MPADPDRDDIPNLVRRLQSGDRAALARLLTLATGPQSAAVSTALQGITVQQTTKSRTPVIALTGSGGVGKSSLLSLITTRFADRGERIGVLACDPESPVTGGALLGDRCRITGKFCSDPIFLRSLSTVSGQQGVAKHLGVMLETMQAFGFDRIFVETVGAGQGDIAIRQLADIVLLALQPQTGDELQWEKAGILEVADVVVVNKADLPGADQTVADIRQQVQPRADWVVPVVTTSVAHDEGIEELCRVIELAADTLRRHNPIEHQHHLSVTEDEGI